MKKFPSPKIVGHFKSPKTQRKIEKNKDRPWTSQMGKILEQKISWDIPFKPFRILFLVKNSFGADIGNVYIIWDYIFCLFEKKNPIFVNTNDKIKFCFV